jgi:arylsulfatase A-like enzyme
MHPATVEKLFGVPDYGCRRGLCASKLLLGIDSGKIAPIPREPEILRYLYTAGVSTADAALGRLFRDLREDGLFDRLLIVVTADHGEGFEEHGKLLHPPEAPYREVLEVPLLIKWPGGRHAGERRTRPSSSLDLAPTLLAAAGLSVGDLPGSILAERSPEAPVYSGTTHKSVIAGGLQAIFPPGGGAPELYDLERDPREMHDLARRRPGEVARMRALLQRRLAADARLRATLRKDGEAPSPDLSPEERRHLEALGYLQ